MAANSSVSGVESAPEDGAETITDIQNYLQSFNKEIGEAAAGDGTPGSGATFYAIDTSHVLTSASGESTVSGSVGGQNSGASGGGNDGSGGYQTVAIVPDSANGGYVLIVQPNPGQTQAQVQIPVTGSTASAPLLGSGTNTVGASNVTSPSLGAESEAASAGNAHKSDEPEPESPPPLARIKEERTEAEKPNDISVYDFDEANPPTAMDAEDEGEDEEEADGGEAEEMDTMGEPGDIKPTLGTPKAKKAKKVGGSAKKAKAASTPSGSNQHMCNYCNYTSNKRYLLSRHMKSHSEERPHKCGICERGFKTIASLQNHVNTHTGVRPHGCKYCDAAFTTSGELVRHVRYRHTHEKPHRCTECDYASVELSKLKRHMRCHTGERPYQCPHCTYASPDTYKLKRHLRIHTGEKPYECDVCHARFTQSNSLKAHRLIHSGNKPIFKCDLCPTTCGRKTDLRIHVQKLHTSDRPLTCKRCDQSFPDRYSFKIHLKTHEGEKCFKCDLCNYASVSARHLESHMLIHTDQKPFQCEECDQSFRQKQLLKRHRNLYHNPEYIPPQPKEKTHECPHCSKAFRHKGNLMRHLAIHDPDAYKDSNVGHIRGNDSHQLIDEEEEEESDEDCDSQMILPNGDEDTMDPQTLQFTLDPQTQQMLQGDQVVVFEVVQMNNNESGTDTDTQNSFIDPSGTSMILDQTPVETKGHKAAIIGKSHAKSLRKATILAQANGASTSAENIIIQLQTEDEEAASALQNDNIIDDPDYSPTKAKITPIVTSSPNNSVPVPLLNEDTKVLRDQLQKQRDLAECFGFKDDDDEDEAILSMPAAHAQ